MGPIDYTLQVVDPINAALQQRGLRFAEEQQLAAGQRADRGLDMEQQRLDMAQQQMAFQQAEAARVRQEQEAAIARQRAGQEAFIGLMFDDNITPEKVMGAVRANPEMAQPIMEFWQGRNAQQAESELNFGKQVVFAIGQSPEQAAVLLEQRALAAENAGDKQTADTYRSQAQMARSGPEGAAAVRAQALMVMAGKMDPKELGEFMQVSGLSTPDPRQEAELAKIRAETDKINVEISEKLNAQPDKSKSFDVEQKLRKEYTALTGDFVAVRDAYRRVSASQESAAGDLSMIFGYMKMLDPGSVVRESEFATAQNAAGVPDQVRNMYNRILSGERLNPEQREMFKAQAEELMKAAQMRETEVRNGLMPTVEEYGLNANRVFGISGDTGGATDDAEFLRAMMEKAKRGETLTPEEGARYYEVRQRMKGGQ